VYTYDASVSERPEPDREARRADLNVIRADSEMIARAPIRPVVWARRASRVPKQVAHA
jgi:hypothetical protein